jgi:carotenoid cleavage dioxygenase-like enzyme
VYDATVGQSYLLVLNATTMVPLATAYTPNNITVAFSLHGHWFPGEAAGDSGGLVPPLQVAAAI